MQGAKRQPQPANHSDKEEEQDEEDEEEQDESEEEQDEESDKESDEGDEGEGEDNEGEGNEEGKRAIIEGEPDPPYLDEIEPGLFTKYWYSAISILDI